LKTHFHGIVDYASRREPAYTVKHYYNGDDDRKANMAVRVMQDFWVSLHRTTLLSTSH
jgi:hypothetical protein